MRKLILQMQVSLDGFNAAGPNDEQQWVIWAWDELKQEVLNLAERCDTELIGRKLALDYIPFWADALQQPDGIMYEAAAIKATQKKVVFSNKLKDAVWENTVLATGDLKEEVNSLKQQKGKDIIVYGGSGLVANLVKEQLIDEFFLFVNPIALGKGFALFEHISSWQHLTLLSTKTYNCGIVLLHYALK
jgi:dihydrofolate reductase